MSLALKKKKEVQSKDKGTGKSTLFHTAKEFLETLLLWNKESQLVIRNHKTKPDLITSNDVLIFE